MMSLTCGGSLFFCAFAFVGFLVLAFVFIYDVASKRFSSESLFFSRQSKKKEFLTFDNSCRTSDHKKKEKKRKEEKKNVTNVAKICTNANFIKFYWFGI